MKFCRMNGPSESEVESLLMSPCWGQTQNGSQDQYLLDGHKLLLEHDLDSLPSDSEQKSTLDALDNLLLTSTSLSALSDLKPLPPFTGYTGHLSINGISGHHYHAIAQRLPDESNNNNYAQSAYQTTITASTTTHHHHSPSSGGGTPSSLSSSSNGNGNNNSHSGGRSSSSADHNIVSSSTCLPESVLSGSDSGPSDACLGDVKLFADSQLDSKLYSVADSCVMTTADQGPDSVHSGVRTFTEAKDLTEYVDMNSIDDIAAIIGSAIADTTVPNQLDHDDGNDTRDSWMDLDAWIDGNCIQQDGKLIVSQQDSLSDFILPNSPAHNGSSTLQSLLTHGYMPLLHNRLQNGPPSSMKGEAPSSTSYCNELSSSTSSPPGSVVSTTDNIMISTRYLGGNPQQYQISMSSIKSDGICSPDLLGNYPHTTTVTTPTTPKAKRSRTQKKSATNNNSTVQQQQQQPQSHHQSQTHQHQQQQQHQHQQSSPQSQMSSLSPSSVNFNSNDLSGLLGKEKPVHRCSICNRGFLNKSNIKVHLRTHTGEKPFRCDVCAKAFRQKAHLLKHQQIHKRIGRD